jgi:hypothetical protein
VGPLVDYLVQCADAGDPVAMKGRTVASLIRRMSAWHRSLAQVARCRRRVFAPSGLQEAAWVVRRRVGAAMVPQETWRFCEILTARDLVAEGSAMRHCVATYVDAAAEGGRSFWSLTCNGKRRLTIEVDNTDRRVCQVRGLANRLPRPHETRRVRAWAVKNGLVIDSWEMTRAARGPEERR